MTPALTASKFASEIGVSSCILFFDASARDIHSAPVHLTGLHADMLGR
jgi:hypothetical protein